MTMKTQPLKNYRSQQKHFQREVHKKSQIKNVIDHLKELEKEEQTKPKDMQKEGNHKRSERKSIQLRFKKQQEKNDKPLARLTKKRRIRTQTK